MKNSQPGSRASKAVRAVTAGVALATLGVVGAFTSATPAHAANASDYISAHTSDAQAVQRIYGVPAAVAMAQSILESGWGESGLTVTAHNYFGIKCNSYSTSQYQTGCYSVSSAEYYSNTGWTSEVSAFRVYASDENSFLDYGQFLSVNGRYANAFNYEGDPDQFITEVWRAGYATDPGYPQKIIKLMQAYNLYALDSLPAPAPTTEAPAPAPATSEAPATTEAPTPSPAPASPSASPSASATPSAIPSATPSASASPSASGSASPSATPKVAQTGTGISTTVPTAKPTTPSPKPTSSAPAAQQAPDPNVESHSEQMPISQIPSQAQQNVPVTPAVPVPTQTTHAPDPTPTDISQPDIDAPTYTVVGTGEQAVTAQRGRAVAEPGRSHRVNQPL